MSRRRAVRLDRWRPQLLDALAGYDRQAPRGDLVAGVTVGVVALPLAMAFGIASGVTPQAGIYTAIVGGFLVSLLGGSRIQIGGPTGAFVVIVAGIIATHGLLRPADGHDDGRRHPGAAGGHRARAGGQVHPAARRPRLHQRHRAADRLHADQGLSRACAIADSPSEFFARMAALGAALPHLQRRRRSRWRLARWR